MRLTLPCGSLRDSGSQAQHLPVLFTDQANQRRVARVSKQIEREIGTMLQGDQRFGYDSSVSALATVTEVRLSSDLQVAKVYLSVFSDPEGRETALKGLSRLQGYVRTKLAHEMQLRLVPEIRFIHDDAAERGEEVLQLLERIKRQDAGQEDLPPVAIASLSGEPREGERPPSAARLGHRPVLSETEDGFLDLEDEEGPLGSEDDEAYDSDEDSLGEDRTAEVVEEFLRGSRMGDFDDAPPAVWATDTSSQSKSGKQPQRRKKKRKFRSKTR